MGSQLSARRRLPPARGRALITALVAAALVLRLVLPMAPMAMPAGIDPVLAELLSGGGICHGDPDAPAKAPAQKGVACVLCPICIAPLPLLAGVAPPLPAPALLATGTALLWPPATAPPAVIFGPASPRGPPALSA